MSTADLSAIAPYTVRVVSDAGNWTVWQGNGAGVQLQIHGLAGDVLEVELTPVLNGGSADHLRLRAYQFRPEGADWTPLYNGPVVPLTPEPLTVTCPKCHYAWAPQVAEPQKCPKCSYRVGAYWRRQRRAAAPREEDQP